MKKILEFIKNKKLYIIITILALVAAGLTVALTIVLLKEDSVPAVSYPDGVIEETEEVTTVPEDTEEKEEIYIPFERRTNGIDVSRWQGEIDWAKVKESGIYFAFIRVGYRDENGIIGEDECAAYNLRQAQANGIMVGVYFFSTAISVAEAEEDAKWVLDYIEGYRISYPVVYDCEGFTKETSRMYNLTATERTDNALAFLDKVASHGYQTMHYGARNELINPEYWEMERIEEKHKVWVAIYTRILYPYLDKPVYGRKMDAWQYSDKGRVNGIETDVDLVVCYFICDLAEAKDSNNLQEETTVIPEVQEPTEDVVNGMKFIPLKDSVTAKIKVNLRSTPSVEEGNVVGELNSGEFIGRVAISEKGWSRLIFEGQTVYAISGYLSAKVIDPDETKSFETYYFDSVSDRVTAKNETNLRTLPTTNGSTVVYTLKNGEYLERTGINVATGWSRLDYNGQTVYAISSYLMLEDSTQE